MPKKQARFQEMEGGALDMKNSESIKSVFDRHRRESDDKIASSFRYKSYNVLTNEWLATLGNVNRGEIKNALGAKVTELVNANRDNDTLTVGQLITMAKWQMEMTTFPAATPAQAAAQAAAPVAVTRVKRQLSKSKSNGTPSRGERMLSQDSDMAGPSQPAPRPSRAKPKTKKQEAKKPKTAADDVVGQLADAFAKTGVSGQRKETVRAMFAPLERALTQQEQEQRLMEHTRIRAVKQKKRRAQRDAASLGRTLGQMKIRG